MSNRRRKLSLAVFATVPVLTIASLTGAQTVYTGPTNGDWGTIGNWSVGIPTLATDAKINSAVGNVNVNLAASTTGNVRTLTIDAGDSMSILNNSTLNVAENLAGGGSLMFMANANESFLNFTSATATNSGLIDFNYQTGAASAGVIQGPGSGTLTNTGTIRGSGSLRNIRFTNAVGGILENYQTGAQLYLDPNNSVGTTFVNSGTIRALTGSTVSFAGDFGGNVLSTGGAIQANGAGAIVRFINSAGVTGGIYSTTGGGEIVVEASHTGSASPQSLSGTLRVRNNATLNLSGAMANNGQIVFSPNGNPSVITVNAPLTLSGTGTIVGEYIGSGSGARIDAPTHLLTLGANQTVRGVVQFSNSQVVNNGLIDANDTASAAVNAGVYVDPYNGFADSFVNNATMRASGGGLLQLAGDFGGNIDNTNGTISAIGNGSVAHMFNSLTIKGGTYTTTGTGRVRVAASHTGSISNATITAGSTFDIANNARLNVSGSMVVLGTLSVEPVANYSYLSIAADTTLSGSGTTRLNSNGAARATTDGVGVLTVAAGHTIRGDGYFQNSKVINNGTIIGDDSTSDLGGTYLDPFNSAGTQFVNNGTIQVVANNFVSLVGDSGGGFTGTGAYRADGANAFMHLANGVTVVDGNYATTGGGEIRVPLNQTARMNSPTIAANSTVAVLNNARLNLNGTVTNNGTIDVRAGANQTYLTIESDVSFAGSGKTVLNSNPGVSSAEISGSGVLTIPAGYTVSGNGYWGNAKVINNGLILADRATGSQYLDPFNSTGTQFVNNATIRAIAGATVTLAGDNGGSFTGAGVYEADGALSFINMISNITVIGGTVTTKNGGVVQIAPGNTATMQDTIVSTGSTLTVPNNSRLNLNGSPILNGALSVTSGANQAYLTINGTTNLNVGTLLLNSNPGFSSAEVSGPGVLNIGASFTVSGNGYFNNARVVNAGTILADRATGSMYLDPFNSTGTQFVNNGIIRASAGATTNLAGDNGGTFTGTGVYRADGTNAKVSLINGIAITGGTFTTTTGGAVGILGGQTATITDSTISAGSTFSVLNNSRLNIAGTITNNGILAFMSSTSQSYLTPTADVTLAGNGVVRLTSTGGTAAEVSFGAGIITVAAAQTVAGNGYFNNARVINNGLILADQPTGSMYIDPFNSTGTQFVHNGTIRAAAGATATLSGDNGGQISGPGVFVADTGGLIQTFNGLGGNVGPITGGGTFRANSSGNVGFLHYRVNALEAINSGRARITQGGGNAGTSKVNSVLVNTNGVVDLTDHGLIVEYTAGNSPAATIRGYIASGRNGGFWNGSGITSSLATNVNGKGIGYGEAADIFETPVSFMGLPTDETSILIRYTLLGDTNLDATVNFDDLLKLAQNYSETITGRVWTTGDFNYDGKTNFDDLLSVAQNYNTALALTQISELGNVGGADFMADFALAQSMVPEPATLSAILGLALLGQRRRDNSPSRR